VIEKTWKVGSPAEALYPVWGEIENYVPKVRRKKQWVVDAGPPALLALLEEYARGDSLDRFWRRVGEIEYWLNEQMARITIKIGTQKIKTYDGTRDYVLYHDVPERTLDFILHEVERVLNWQKQRENEVGGQKSKADHVRAGKADKKPRAILAFIRKCIEKQPDIDLKYLVGLVPELRKNARTVLIDGRPFWVYRIKSTLIQEDKEGIKPDHRLRMRSLEPYVSKIKREIREKATH
jgi:hypothetical protein